MSRRIRESRIYKDIHNSWTHSTKRKKISSGEYQIRELPCLVENCCCESEISPENVRCAKDLPAARLSSASLDVGVVNARRTQDRYVGGEHESQTQNFLPHPRQYCNYNYTTFFQELHKSRETANSAILQSQKTKPKRSTPTIKQVPEG